MWRVTLLAMWLALSSLSHTQGLGVDMTRYLLSLQEEFVPEKEVVVGPAARTVSRTTKIWWNTAHSLLAVGLVVNHVFWETVEYSCYKIVFIFQSLNSIHLCSLTVYCLYCMYKVVDMTFSFWSRNYLYLTGKVTLKSVSKLLHWKTNWLFWQQSFYLASLRGPGDQ